MPQQRVGAKNGSGICENFAMLPPRPPQRAVARAVSNLGNTWYVLARKREREDTVEIFTLVLYQSTVFFLTIPFQFYVLLETKTRKHE